MRTLTRIILISLLAIVIGCVYTNKWGSERIDSARQSVCIIETKIQFKLSEKGTTQIKDIKAIAIPIGDGLIIALTHATSLPEVVPINFGFMIMGVKTHLIDISFLINGHPAELVGREKGTDISLFRMEGMEAFPYSFGNSDDVKIGDEVLVVGYSFNQFFNVKDGVVSETNIPDEGFFKELSDICFLISVPVNPGDSGSPLLAKNYNGHLEIVGIVNAMGNGNGLGFAIKSNVVTESIKNILKRN